jgi:hypothetical protein
MLETTDCATCALFRRRFGIRSSYIVKNSPEDVHNCGTTYPHADTCVNKLYHKYIHLGRDDKVEVRFPSTFLTT